MFLSTRPGDPTTPGYASHEGSPRAATDDVTPSIPSIPISYSAALPLLQALNGHGPTADDVNRTVWAGALEADYSTGPAPGVVLTLDNQMEEKIAPVWNVIAFLNGTNTDETLVIGNHRDTWMIGGNGDPNSGSAVLIELSKAFNKLIEGGWKPRRNMYVECPEPICRFDTNDSVFSHPGMPKSMASLVPRNGLRSMRTGLLTRLWPTSTWTSPFLGPVSTSLPRLNFMILPRECSKKS